MWKDVKGYEGLYKISSNGIIKKYNGKIKKPSVNEKGYLRIAISKNGKEKTYRVHRLVAENFIPNPLMLKEVNHIDEDKKNNSVSNLEWCDRKSNIEHSIKTGSFKICPVEQYDKSGNLIKRYDSVSEAERITDIPKTHISKVCLGRYGFKTAGGYVWKYKDRSINEV